MEDVSLGTILLALCAGASVACMAYVVLTTLMSARAETRRYRSLGRPSSSVSFKLMRPVARAFATALGMLSARVEMALRRPAEKSFLLGPRLWAEKNLRAASYPEGVSAEEFLGLVLLGGVAGALIGALFNIRLKINFIVLLFAVGGMYMPLLWLRGQVRQRREDIRRGLPYALDLLTLSVEAGLDFTQALSRIVRKLGNTPLGAELGQMVRDIQLGRTRSQALRELGRRVDVPELNSIVSALIQADELGSSLGPILRIQADQLRTRRSQTAEKLAMEAPVKILLPLILFIFPTIFIMIFGPIALKLLT
jgi:tight adherence protein C